MAVFEFSDSPRTRGRLRMQGWALFGSFAVHLLVFLALGWTRAPRAELPIRLPLELEIGLGESEEQELGGASEVEGKRSEVENRHGQDTITQPAAAKPRAAAAEVVADVAKPTEAPSEQASTVDAGISGESADATDAAVSTEAQLAGSGTADAGPTGPRRGIGGGEGSGFGINGALLALRIDVPNVRKSALILETEALLSIVPGWQRMFAGSGLSPLQHFQRFVIATPNLHPSRLSMAASVRPQLRGMEALKTRVGGKQPLRRERDMDVGVWSARGTTRREIAFINDMAFAIARAQDLMRLLSLAHVLGSQIDDVTRDSDPRLAGLMHMGKTEALSLGVHHVAAFVPDASSAVPDTLHFVLKDPSQHAVELHVTGHYASAALAERALVRWRQTYEDFAARPEVQLLGLMGAIEHATFERVDHDVIARTELTMAQLRHLLGELRDMLQRLVPDRAE